MRRPENLERSGPEPEDPKEMRRDVRRLLKKSHTDVVGSTSQNPDDVAKILISLLDAVKDGRAPRTWTEVPKENEPAQFSEGRPVVFIRKEESGEVHELPITLPKWTKIFRNALDAFLSGKSDEEVLNILTFDPAQADRNAQRGLMQRIKDAKNVQELLAVQDDIQKQKFLFPDSRQKLLREIVGSVAGAYSQTLSKAEKMSDLAAIFDDLRLLINESSIAAKDDKDYFLGVFSAIVDARAASMGEQILEDGEDEKRLDAVASFITAVGAFPFSDAEKKKTLVQRGNEMAHQILMESMKKTRTEKGLERLHEYVYRFPFSPDDAGEALRHDVHNWIEKKWYSYLSPEALEAQALAGRSEQT